MDGLKTMFRESAPAILVSVVTTVILAAGSLAWNFLSSGGLVTVIGGVTHDELQKQLRAQREEISRTIHPGLNSHTLPDGAIVAFNLPQCPHDQGWYDETREGNPILPNHTAIISATTPQDDAVQHDIQIGGGGGQTLRLKAYRYCTFLGAK